MASPYNQTYNRSSVANVASPYFIVTVTNYPELIHRTERFQRPHQGSYQRCQGGMLIPGVNVHFGPSLTDEHERLLYNTVRFKIQEIIQEYLQRTRQPYPIYLVIDMTDMRSHR